MRQRRRRDNALNAPKKRTHFGARAVVEALRNLIDEIWMLSVKFR
jgi:hypothetical protein